MIRSTRRSQRAATASLLLLALAITTGWTQTAAPSDRYVPSGGIAALPAAAAQRVAVGLQLAYIPAPSGSSNLAAHRASEATMADGARTLYQARTIAGRAAAVAAVLVKAPVRVKAPVVKAAPKVYSGTNHFWFPALGISRPVYTFACTRTREPDNYVYRWGCAGRNNVYLLGHAWGVFKPLHDAYVAGRLRVGMLAYYADGSGRVRTYKITTWRVVNPTNSSWAIANQSVPSMTLQTCVGLNRLNVRLVAIN